MKGMRQVLGAAILVSFLGAAAVCGADDPAQKAAREKQAKNLGVATGAKSGSAEGANLHVKSFRLKHCEPLELRQALSQLLQAASGGVSTAVTAGGASTVTRAGGLMGGGYAAGPYWVVDERTRTLLVRGSDAEIEKIGSLIEVLDLEPGKTPPENTALHVVRLQHAKVDEALQALNGLHLSMQVLALPKSNLIIVPASSPSVKEIDAVIETLDVPGTAQGKEKPAPKAPSKKP
jgi:type II secretory pathway component GspD/PulD (secretin)